VSVTLTATFKVAIVPRMDSARLAPDFRQVAVTGAPWQ